MKIKPLMVFNVVLTICLVTALLFTSGTLTGESKEYDPWCDLDEDGVVDMADIAIMIDEFMTYGEPINRTALLLCLHKRLDSLNATVIELKSEVDTLKTDVVDLNASLVQLQARVGNLTSTLTSWIEDLEANLQQQKSRTDSLNASYIDLLARVEALENQSLPEGFMRAPKYDSNWTELLKGEDKPFEHNLGTTDVLVYVIGSKFITGVDPHQISYGGWVGSAGMYWEDAYWHDLDTTHIKVFRNGNDPHWNYVRVMIWILEPPT